MTLLVVGSNGFIGTAIRAKSRSKDQILGISSTPGRDEFLLDLREANRFDYSVLPENSTVVFLAAVSSPDYCSSKPQEASEINVAGTRTFIGEALARGFRVIFFSSDVVFGECSGPANENTPRKPAGIYGAMKLEIEECFSGVPNFKVIRPSYIVSLNDKFSSYLRGCVRTHQPAEVFHPLLRSAIHVDDVVTAVDNLYRDWEKFTFQSVNICGSRLVSRIDLAQVFCKSGGFELDVKVIDPPPGFFNSRPPVIEMRSLHLESLLGRSPLDLEGALRDEIKLEQNQ